MGSNERLTVKVAQGLSGQRFAKMVKTLKTTLRMRYDATSQTWTMSDDDDFVARQLRSYAENDMLVIVAAPAATVTGAEPIGRVRTADLVAGLARQGYRPSFGRGATPVEADDYGDQGQVL